jgi:acyl carrier protein
LRPPNAAPFGGLSFGIERLPKPNLWLESGGDEAAQPQRGPARPRPTRTRQAARRADEYKARPRIALRVALGYTDRNERYSDRPPSGRRGKHASCVRAEFQGLQRVIMSSTFDTVANIIAETCDVPREQIKPESHAIDDLGIDSLDMLDIAFAIDKAFGIKIPLEEWTQEVNDGKATTDKYFVLGNLCTQIDSLVAAKQA